MTDDAPAYYVTTIDRVGHALLAAGGAVGAVAGLLASGGSRLVVAGIAAGIAMLGIVTVVGPIWFVLHRRNLRGPGVAAVTMGGLTMALSVFAQMWGEAGGYRWASAVGTSLIAAVVGAGIGWLMQRVAYRRLM